MFHASKLKKLTIRPDHIAELGSWQEVGAFLFTTQTQINETLVLRIKSQLRPAIYVGSRIYLYRFPGSVLPVAIWSNTQ